MSDFSLLPTPPDNPDGHAMTAPASGTAKTRMMVINPKSFWDRRVLGLLDSRQDTLIFDPHPKDVKKMEHPSKYKELEGLDITERVLVTERDKKGQPTATITLWEHKSQPGKEHYILFNGKTGHIADIGALPDGVSGEGYDKKRDLELDYERHGGLTFLKELANEGAGFTAVTVRGYGNNLGEPSEKGFEKDIDVFLADRKARQDKDPASVVPAERTVIAGVSLGTGIAAMLASKMTAVEGPPAMLALVNPYKRFSAAADHSLRSQPFKYKALKGIPFAEDIRNLAFDIPRDVLEQILRTTFRTDQRIEELHPDTSMLVITSGKDTIIPPENSADLVSIAKSIGLRAKQCIYEYCGHHNLPIKLVAKDVKAEYQEHLKQPRQDYPELAANDSTSLVINNNSMPPQVKSLGQGRYSLETSQGKKFVLTVPKDSSLWTEKARQQPAGTPDISI